MMSSRKRTSLLTVVQILAFLLPHLASGSENLVTNGSFEVGSWGWSPVFWIESAIDDAVAYDGTHALLLKGPFNYGNGWGCSTVQSQYFLLETGNEYTLSFYAKSGKDGTAIWAALISGYQETDQDALYQIKERFTLTSSWKKYEVKGYLQKGGSGIYLIQFGITGSEDPIWLDAVSVTKGGAGIGEYKRKPIEAALYTEKGGYYTKGDEIRISASVAIDPNLKERLSLHYSLFDYFGERISEWRKEISPSSSGSRYGDEVIWRSDRYGIFRTEFEVICPSGLRSNKSEAVFAVLPPLQRLPSENSPFGTHLPLVPEMAAIARNLGIKWVRLHDMEDFTNWVRAEPEKGQFVWFDDRVELALANGINILGVIEKPPYWASKAKPEKGSPLYSFMGYPPGDLEDFRNYVYTMIKHYKGKIRYWEIWNEPYISSFWNGTKQEFVSLMKTAYEAAKEADPNCIVVAPAGRWEFIRDIFELGAYKYLDVLSYHQYFANNLPWNSFSSEIEMVRNFKALMKKYGVNKPIWNTEGGLISRSFYQSFLAGETPWLRNFTQSDIYDYKRPANLIVKWYVINLSEGVGKCFYYYMREDGTGYFNSRETYQSLLEYDRKPKPHAVALAVLAHFIGTPIQFVNQERKDLSDGYFAVNVFKNQYSAVAVGWYEGKGDMQGSVKTQIPKQWSHVMDIMGNEFILDPAAGNVTLPVQKEPFYVAVDAGVDIEEFERLLKKALDTWEYKAKQVRPSTPTSLRLPKASVP